jgi:hypothetical protein
MMMSGVAASTYDPVLTALSLDLIVDDESAVDKKINAVAKKASSGSASTTSRGKKVRARKGGASDAATSKSDNAAKSAFVDDKQPADATDSGTPLHDAVDKGDLSTTARLAKSSDLLNQVNERGETPLHVAAGKWERDSISTEEHGPEMVELLLKCGAKVDSINSTKRVVFAELGATPLLVACSTDGSADIVKSLLAAGANPNAQDERGDTPLKKALGRWDLGCQDSIGERTQRVVFNRAEKVRLLIRNGASLFISSFGRSPMRPLDCFTSSWSHARYDQKIKLLYDVKEYIPWAAILFRFYQEKKFYEDWTSTDSVDTLVKEECLDPQELGRLIMCEDIRKAPGLKKCLNLLLCRGWLDVPALSYDLFDDDSKVSRLIKSKVLKGHGYRVRNIFTDSYTGGPSIPDADRHNLRIEAANAPAAQVEEADEGNA